MGSNALRPLQRIRRSSSPGRAVSSARARTASATRLLAQFAGKSSRTRHGRLSQVQPQRIIYVLASEADRLGVPRLELKVMSTRLLKDGALSQSAHNFEPRTALNSSSPAKYLRPSDFRIFRKIMMARDASGYYSSAPLFMSDEGFEL